MITRNDSEIISILIWEQATEFRIILKQFSPLTDKFPESYLEFQGKKNSEKFRPSEFLASLLLKCQTWKTEIISNNGNYNKLLPKKEDFVVFRSGSILLISMVSASYIHGETRNSQKDTCLFWISIFITAGFRLKFPAEANFCTKMWNYAQKFAEYASKGIEFLSQTLIFFSLYLFILLSETLDISNHESL